MWTENLEKLTACLNAVHTAEGVAEGVQGARFSVFVRREVLFHFLDNPGQFFGDSVSVLLFTAAALQVFALRLVFLAPALPTVFPRGQGPPQALRGSPPGARRSSAGHAQVFASVHLPLGARTCCCFFPVCPQRQEFTLPPAPALALEERSRFPHNVDAPRTEVRPGWRGGK